LSSTDFTITATNAIGSDSLVLSIAVTEASITCDFGTADVCGWAASTAAGATTTDRKWKQSTGETPTTGTGPVAAPSGSTTDGYMFMESSGGADGDISVFTSPRFESNGATLSVTFSYHMFGAGTGTLTLSTVADPDGAKTSTTQWTKSGQEQGSAAAAWTAKTVVIDLTGSPKGTMLALQFTAMRKDATDTSDIALDNVGAQFSDATPIQLPSYAVANAVYTVTEMITNNAPTVSGGTPSSWTVSSPLPEGITLNPTTGLISGTPKKASGTLTYVITANNAETFATTTVTIKVADLIPSLDAYSTSDANSYSVVHAANECAGSGTKVGDALTLGECQGMCEANNACNFIEYAITTAGSRCNTDKTKCWCYLVMEATCVSSGTAGHFKALKKDSLVSGAQV